MGGMQPEQVMQEVADFLQIPFEEILTRPTVNRHPARANTAYPETIPEAGQLGVDRVDKWKQVLTRAEIEIIDYYLGGIMQDFGYEVTTKTSLLRNARNLIRVRRQYTEESNLYRVDVLRGLRRLIPTRLRNTRR